MAAAAVVGGGCGSGGAGSSTGSSTAGTSPSRETAALDLKAGGNAYNVTQCGNTHHYTTYGAGHRIEYGAQITPPPSGKFTIKIKIKRCRSGAFGAVASTHSPGDSTGYASGFLPRVPSGFYFARLYRYQGRATASQSDKEYFSVG